MALPRTYDSLFAQYGAGLPVNFLRALAKRESNLNPSSVTGSYIGLLQVGHREVLPGYNQRHGTSYTASDLYTPAINVKVGADHIRNVVNLLSKNHPRTLRENWSNPEYAKLVVAAWNSGHSEAGGVGRVATYLEQHGLPVTHDNVFKYAAAAGATKHLQNSTKYNWQRSVSDLFYAEGGPDTLSLLTVAMIAFVGYGAYHLWWRKA